MKKRKKKAKFFGFKDKFARRRTFLVLGIIILCFVLKIILCGNYIKKEPKELSFLLDNEIVKLKNEIFLDDNETVYISKEDISNIFDKTLYYNEAEKELIIARYYTEMTQKEASDVLGLSQSQVSRTEAKVLKKLKERLVA